jgi:hypothetical protein
MSNYDPPQDKKLEEDTFSLNMEKWRKFGGEEDIWWLKERETMHLLRCIFINGAICGTPHHVAHGATQWCFSMELLVKVLVVMLILFDGVGDQVFMGVV